MTNKTSLAGISPLFYDNLHKIVDFLPSGKHGKYFVLSIMRREKIKAAIIEACEKSNFLYVHKSAGENSNSLTFYNSL